jgi:molybdopterin converting factor small subunit
MAVIRIPSPLRQHTDGADQVDLPGESVGAVLSELVTRHPGIEPRLFKPGPAGRQLNRFVNLYVNDEDVRFLQNLDTPLKTGDVISIVPAIAGGSIVPAIAGG